ncbi:MAG: ABC transporter permease [Bacteroidetes bacterium]|nr:ABC transporter permease [Bacteroidota bacterium]
MEPSSHIPPPKWLLRFFRWYCHPDFAEDIEGDLCERFARYVEEDGIKKAKRRFAREVVLLCRPGIIRPIQYNYTLIETNMLKNHLTSAWRNLWKRKEFSILNIAGLALGMAACLLILQYIKFELSYDKFHPDISRLYRLNLTMESPVSGKASSATNHPAAGPAIKNDFPQIEEFARLVEVAVFAGSSVIIYKPENQPIKTFYEEDLYIADTSFLQMFDYPLIAGEASTALADPKGIVISESMAKQFFGEEEAMGKILSLNGFYEVKVTGVLKDLPENTHLKIRALFSFNLFNSGQDNTWIWPEYYTYVKLAPNTDVKNLESQLDGFVNKYLGAVMKEFGIIERMNLQPVSDIHLHSNLSKEAQENGNYRTISFLMLIAGMILLIAWINYVNLSTARATERAAEVGIRKVIGAQKWNLITQFLIESAVVNVLAILLAIVLVFLAAPSFNQLVGLPVINSLWLTEIWAENTTWLTLVIMLIGGTFLAGLYPAFVLSSYQPVKTLKSKLYQSGKKFNFRHLMVVFQFSVSYLLIAGTLMVFSQLRYMQNQDLGFNMDQVLVVKSPSVIDSTYQEKTHLFREKLLQETHILHFSASSDIPGHLIQNINSIKNKGQATEEARFATYIFADEEFFQTYEIELVAGREFSKEMSTDENAVILNEKSVESLGFSSPEEAIGKIITRKLNQWEDFTIIGVAKNMNHRSLAFGQEPFAFFYTGGSLIDYFNFKVSTEDLPRTIANIERMYEEIFPNNPIEYFFLDEYFARQYKAEQQFGKVFSIFSGLAILVACLGLFGLASYLAARRKKEIGIRKVLGASSRQILVLLGKQFVVLMIIATAIAIPFAWWGGDQWLNQYAYHIDLSVWLFVIPVMMVLGIAVLTVTWQTLRAAHSDPVDSLRYE